MSALAEAIFAAVEAPIDRSTGPFVLHALAHAEPPPGLASRAVLVGRETLALLAARRRRAFRRHHPGDTVPEAFDQSWLLVQLVALGRDRFLVSAAAPQALPAGGFDLARWPGGDAPVAIDRAPPSRAYQKLEEAFAWMGTAPRASETCVDLGASPGGWTATVVKRGARALAVDRAPLAPALARHPLVDVGDRKRLHLPASGAGRLARVRRRLRAATQPGALRRLAVGRALSEPGRHGEIQGARRVWRAGRSGGALRAPKAGLRPRQAALTQQKRGHRDGPQ